MSNPFLSNDAFHYLKLKVEVAIKKSISSWYVL